MKIVLTGPDQRSAENRGAVGTETVGMIPEEEVMKDKQTAEVASRTATVEDLQAVTAQRTEEVNGR